jgi:hypothetical protein
MNEDDDLLPPQPSPLKARLGIAAAILAGLLVIGGIGELSGAGWFAHRSIMWGEGELYVLNMGDEPLKIVADGVEREEVAARDARIIPLIGGTTHISLSSAAGEPRGVYDVTIDGSYALLKVGSEVCLAVADITPYYGGKRTPQGVPIQEVVGAEQALWIAGSRNVVWPRREFPKILAGGDGPGRWVEMVGCDLLEDRAFLSGYLELRLQERLKALKAPPAPAARPTL